MMRQLVLLLALPVLAACTQYASDIDRRVCSQIAKPYFSRHIERDTEEYRTLDLETQYVIYICSQLRAEPPRLELAEVLSERGESAVPFLTAKLQEARSEQTVRAMIDVLYVMHRRGRYDVRADAALMSLLRTKLAAMREGPDRSLVEDWLDELERPA